jgi:hypothetical protein
MKNLKVAGIGNANDLLPEHVIAEIEVKSCRLYKQKPHPCGSGWG